jgi:hypothetical protein
MTAVRILAGERIDTGKGFCVPEWQWYWLWSVALVGAAGLAVYWRYWTKKMSEQSADPESLLTESRPPSWWAKLDDAHSIRVMLWTGLLSSVGIAAIVGLLAWAVWLAVDILWSLWGITFAVAVLRSDWRHFRHIGRRRRRRPD